METVPIIQTKEDRSKYSKKWYNQYSENTTFKIILLKRLPGQYSATLYRI
jgi:hypothetical protein